MLAAKISLLQSFMHPACLVKLCIHLNHSRVLWPVWTLQSNAYVVSTAHVEEQFEQHNGCVQDQTIQFFLPVNVTHKSDLAVC